ncbi:G-protein beta WD-40 repeat containing protein [Cryptosporidium felis]|nr:G-protein beta WD-40 repeat containing protein [Cryptosporidium felis]
MFREPLDKKNHGKQVGNEVNSFTCSPIAFDLNYNSQFNQVDRKTIESKQRLIEAPEFRSEDPSLLIKKKRSRFDHLKNQGIYYGPWNYSEKETRFDSQTSELEPQSEELGSTDCLIGANYSDDDQSSNLESAVSTFLGNEHFDYQSRSWMRSPNEIKERLPDSLNYIPKKLKTVLNGHSMGVQSIKYVPVTGHLLLSASLDSQIKIWNTNDNKCIYIYHGHNNAVRDIQFSNNKRNCGNFYSCGYDRQLLLWDIEFGKILWRNINKSTPYCISVHPANEKSIIVGYNNKKALQFDVRSKDSVQEYAEHQGAVNSVTFCENGDKFVTTSDDKKMFVWDYGVPIVVKHIADPLMQSMPYVTLHSDGQHLICQSMNNKILVYDSHNNFKCIKKRFTGLRNSGYAIKCDVSPDGRYLLSGDISGKIHFWDWKTTKIIKSIQAHNGVSIGCNWHPVFPSRIATCGWDGTVKIWE